MPESIADRKFQHIKIALAGLGEYKTVTSGLEKVKLEYTAMPELDKDEVDISTQFLGRKISMPLLVSGMTGGCKEAEKINKDIAIACEEFGIPQGVGSQRAMLADPSLTYSYQVKDVAPKVFLFGNLGAVQLKNYSVAQIEKMLSDIKADGLAIHLNPAQEAVQPEGTTQFSGVYKLIDKVSKELSKPVYVKEVGHGISATVAEQLAKTKISALDVNGAGGTSWAKIEYLRKTKHKAGPYEEFGIPTADAIQQCRKVFPRTLIATGGIKNGFDVVKSLVLGADVCGMAYPILVAQDKGGAQGVKEFLEKTADEIRTGLFLLGAKNISELKKLKPLQN